MAPFRLQRKRRAFVAKGKLVTQAAFAARIQRDTCITRGDRGEASRP